MEFYYDSVDGNVLILSADGGLMASNADRFVGELERYIELGNRQLIVDCSKLIRVTSYGLGVLVSLHKRLAKQGGDVKLACVPSMVGNVIRMTGLTHLFQMYSTVDEARAAFNGDARPRNPETRHPDLD